MILKIIAGKKITYPIVRTNITIMSLDNKLIIWNWEVNMSICLIDRIWFHNLKEVVEI